ncbi:MAG: hypothetical protein IIV90_04860, partial [Oscillospiraceae bacterium]|nr:hypothetical protein [Oscillospiraceae bacterium]
PESAVGQGADLVIQSLHKTLPALTQTALLHNCTGRIADAAISHQLDIFETSSPSYLLMASVDSCLRYMESRGKEEMGRYREQLEAFAKKSAEWKNLKLFTKESFAEHPGFCPEMDPGKLVIGCRGRGPELAEKLRQEYKIELEMTQPDHVLAMTSLMDAPEGFERLARALLALDGQLEEACREEAGFVPPAVPGQVLPIDRALDGERETVCWADALGRVSAGYLWAYPPGIPWLAPGERIGGDCLKAAEAAARAGISLIKTWDAPEGQIAVLKETAKT